VRLRIALGLLAAVVAAGLVWLAMSAHAPSRLLTLGTGGSQGVYYLAGGGICALVNRERHAHGIRCIAEKSEGSVANLRALRRGRLDMALVQSDWQRHALDGSAIFEDAGPFPNLRSMLSLHAEPLTVIARADAGIDTLEDLKGKRVNLGSPGSGQRATMAIVMDALGWSAADIVLAAEHPSAAEVDALCDGEVDAIVSIAGHPNRAVEYALAGCAAVLIPVPEPLIELLVRRHAYFFPMTIPGGLYPSSPEDVPTFGVRATLVTTAGAATPVVYEVVRAVFTHLPSLRATHPALDALEPAAMATAGLSAPLHPGAARYFAEAGLGER
jgi:TRAP transporter TAXI family solute receptor